MGIVYGEYDNNNFFKVNIVNNDDVYSTHIHESIHLMLTQATMWGNLSYAMKKVNLIDHSKEAFVNFLHKHTVKVHEATAVYFEMFYTLKEEGELSVRKRIKYLKMHNNDYYNYLKPILPLFNKVLIDTEDVEENANQLTTIIYHIALSSLSTKICKITINHFINRKSIKKFISNSKLSGGILPFQRFKYLLNEALIKIENSEKLDSGEILIELLDIEEHINSFYDMDKNETEMKKMKSFLLDLFDQSLNKNEIEDYLNTIKNKQVDIENSILYGVPNSFEEYKSSLVNGSNALKKVLDETTQYGVFFILGKGIDCFESIRSHKIISNISNSDIKKIKNKLGKDYATIVFDFKRKRKHLTKISRGGLLFSLSECNHPIIVSYKAFDFENMRIKGLPNIKNELFIYCDRAYPNTIELLNKISTDLEYGIIIEYKYMLVLFIKLTGNRNFILPILRIVEHRIRQDIEEEKLQLELLNADFVNDREISFVNDESEMRKVNFPVSKINMIDRILENIFQV